jgi:alpha-L-fucosidase 2
MLVQSHQRLPGSKPDAQQFVVHLLPALPKAWPNGSVRGLRARGGFTVDLDWRDGKVTWHRISSPNPRDLMIRVNGGLRSISAERLPAVSEP